VFEIENVALATNAQDKTSGARRRRRHQKKGADVDLGMAEGKNHQGRENNDGELGLPP
jgi:hypothetical protein